MPGVQTQYNRNQVFVINTIYELPIGKGKRFMGDAGRAMDLVVGGWQITNTTHLRHRSPVDS